MGGAVGAGGGLTWTLRSASLLRVLAKWPVTTTEKAAPSSATEVGAVVNEDAVAPAMAMSFRLHWKVSGPGSFGARWATRVKVAVCPASTVTSCGSTSMTGVGTVVTVRIAPALVVLPAGVDTTTVKTVPESARTVGAVVNDAAVALGMSTPRRRHWKESGAVPVATTVNVAV